MRKVLLVLVGVLLATSVSAQAVDIEEVDPSELDFGEVDLSGAELYFNGAVDLYVTGVRYRDTVYSAVLSYDGGETVDIRAPRIVTTAGKPTSLDLSRIAFSLAENGVEIEGVIADGRRYSGILSVTPRNDLRVAGVRRGARVTAPAAEVEALQQEIARLERTIEQRNARIERLNEQIEDLPEEERVTRLREQIRDLEDDLQSSQSRVSRLEEQLESEESEVARLENVVEQRDDRIDRLQSQIEEMPEEERVAELRRQVNELEDELEIRNSRISTLQDRLEDIRTEPWETAPERLDTVVLSSLGGGRTGMGSWQTSSAAVTQNDADQFFAKYIVPTRQGTGELYYRFAGRALGSGKQGFGLHFLAGDSRTPRGYGYGISYLVWLTRDEAAYQTPSTYVQLYRSYDDVRMVELQSSSVDASITSNSIVEVHVDRDRNLITVLVNDERVLAYRADPIILRGSEVVVRTMGRAVIRDLQIRTGR